MKNKPMNNSRYVEARAKWAKEQTELFLNALEQIGNSQGIRVTPLQYVKAHKMCIEEYGFGYPAEYKIAELISTEVTYEQILIITAELMKRFRLAFQREYKRQLKKEKRKESRGKAA